MLKERWRSTLIPAPMSEPQSGIGPLKMPKLTAPSSLHSRLIISKSGSSTAGPTLTSLHTLANSDFSTHS